MLLSIITVNLNNEKGLAATMRSVFAQDFNDFEYILIDGGSKDESLSIIEEHRTKLAYCIIEPDSGIYSAMNKGIAHATGKYLLFLNSGDTLTSKEILSQFFNKTANCSADIFYTDANLINEQKKTAWIKQYPYTLTTPFFIQSALCHQTTIIAKKVLDKLGNYDENYTLSSDWMLSFTAFKKGYRYQKIEHLVLSNFVLNGFSTDFKLSREQRQSFIKTQYPAHLNAYLKFIRKKNMLERIKIKAEQLFSNFSLAKKKENYVSYINSLKESIWKSEVRKAINNQQRASMEKSDVRSPRSED